MRSEVRMNRDTSESTAPGGPQAAAPRRVPLVVDLDGTLVRTDTLHEALLALFARAPWMLLRAFGWLSRGRSGFKRALADLQGIDVERLPYNESLLARLRNEARTRDVVL